MYKKDINRFTSGLEMGESYEGETMERMVERLTTSKEPIKQGTALIYTARKEGVLAEHDIRTDRWDIAISKMGEVQKSLLAKREDRYGEAQQTSDAS